MPAKKKTNEEGYSLIELLTVSVILLIILGIISTVVSGVQSNYRVQRERAEKHYEALASMNLITKILKVAGNKTTQPALTPTGSNRLQIISDWNPADDAVDDVFENVQFYVSDNKLLMIDASSGTTPNELARNIQSITFEYFDVGGASTAVMTNVAMVRVTISIIGEPQPLISNISLRGKIQPR